MAHETIVANVFHPTDYESGVPIDVTNDSDGNTSIVCRIDGDVVALDLNTIMAARLLGALEEAVASRINECCITIGYTPEAGE